MSLSIKSTLEELYSLARGARKLHIGLQSFLKQHNIGIGRDRFIEVLRAHELLLKPLPQKPTTTHYKPYLPTFSNLIKDKSIERANEAWVSDITYLKTDEGYLYLSLITDLGTRKILGYQCSDSLETQGCIKALEQALKTLGKTDQAPIHHSDRGSQYASHAYVQKLKEHGLAISMTEENHCYENAVAERVNGILKQEYALGCQFATKSLAKKAVDQVILIYNNYRLHKSLNYQTPNQVYQKHLNAA